jgi:hypothetical protein
MNIWNTCGWLFGAYVLLVFAWFRHMAANAPMGHEDENGFHYDE